jgi:hypothetical protein
MAVAARDPAPLRGAMMISRGFLVSIPAVAAKAGQAGLGGGWKS